MFLPPSLQYIVIHCGTNNIWHYDLEVISDGLINLAHLIKKKYKCLEIIIKSLLLRDKTNLWKSALAIATNVYLKEACNNSSFNFVELDTGWMMNFWKFLEHVAFRKWSSLSHKIRPWKTFITLCQQAQFNRRNTAGTAICL